MLVYAQHEHVPFTDGHEIICKKCAQVIGSVPERSAYLLSRDELFNGETPQKMNNGEFFMCGLDKMMLPLTVTNKIDFWQDNFDKPLMNYYRVLDRLYLIVERLHLPKYYAVETMRRLLKKDKGLYSLRLQIQELIAVLKNANDKRLDNRIVSLELELSNASGI